MQLDSWFHTLTRKQQIHVILGSGTSSVVPVPRWMTPWLPQSRLSTLYWGFFIFTWFYLVVQEPCESIDTFKASKFICVLAHWSWIMIQTILSDIHSTILHVLDWCVEREQVWNPPFTAGRTFQMQLLLCSVAKTPAAFPLCRYSMVIPLAVYEM